jgi:hypothetical protein
LSRSEQPVYPSRGLEVVTRQLERWREPRVLDLGAVNGENVNFLSRYGARLSIADLRSALSGVGASGGTLEPRMIEKALALSLNDETNAGDGRTPERFKLVLAWDLFDYLSEEHRNLLGLRLSELTTTGSLLFFFVSYRESIREIPRNYSLIGDAVVPRPSELSSGLRLGTRPSPRIKEPQLLRSLPGFAVEATYLLRNGLQEYCLIRT